MQKITYCKIFLIIGFVLIGLTALEFQGYTFGLASTIAFVMALYYLLRDDQERIQEDKKKESSNARDIQKSNKDDESLEILKKRYAKEEITTEEYEHMKRELEYLEVEREKKGYSVEELNKINESKWKKNNPIDKEFQKEIHAKIQALRDANADDNEIEQLMLSHGFEGKNIDENGKSYWVCGNCSPKIKFNTREDYINHHFQVHS